MLRHIKYSARNVTYGFAFLLVLISTIGCNKHKSSTENKGAGDSKTTASSEVHVVNLKPQTTNIEHFKRSFGVSVPLTKTPMVGSIAPAEEDGFVLYGSVSLRSLDSGEPLKLNIAVEITRGESQKTEDEKSKLAPWRLYADVNYEAKFDVKNSLQSLPVVQTRNMAGQKIKGRTARFGGLNARLSRHGAGQSTLLIIDVIELNNSYVAVVRTGISLAGEIPLSGDESMRIELFDANSNGSFNDIFTDYTLRADDVWIDLNRDGKIDTVELRPLTRVFLSKDKLYELTLSPHKLAVMVKELPRDTGSLIRKDAFKDETLLVQTFSPPLGLVGPLPASELPVGSHQLLQYQIERKAEDGTSWSVLTQATNALPTEIEISKNLETTKVFGQPFEFSARFMFDGGKANVQFNMMDIGGLPSLIIAKDVKDVVKAWRVIDSNGAELARGVPRQLMGVYFANITFANPPSVGTELIFEVVLIDGCLFSSDITNSIKFVYGENTKYRLFVADVTPGGNAAMSGVEHGDIILSYDETEIYSFLDMAKARQGAASKNTVELIVMRKNMKKTFIIKSGQLGVNLIAMKPKGKSK